LRAKSRLKIPVLLPELQKSLGFPYRYYHLSGENIKQTVRGGKRVLFFFPLQLLDLEKKTGMKFVGRSVSTMAKIPVV
jgi:hypothetical protein